MSVLTRLRGFFDGSMRANAVALVANQLASASLGFVYWLLAARLYAVEAVGMSSAVISTIQLLSGLAQFGLVSGMQRFIPRAGRHARRLALTSYAVVTVSAVLAGVGALLVASSIAPGQGIFGTIPPVYVVLAAVAWTLFYLQDGVLVGLREAVWVFIENFAYNLAKIVLLVVAAGVLSRTGIIASWFVPAPVAVLLVSGLIFGRLLHPSRLSDHDDPSEHVTTREIVTSISGDHVGALVAEASLRVLPLLVVRLAGVEANAYFYQAWMISTVLGLVASGMANSFTADTAADRRRVAPNSRAILRTMALLLLPAALAVGIGAPLLMRVFGESYAREGAALLRVLALAVAPGIVNAWYVSYLRVMGDIRTLIWVRIASSAVLVAGAYAGLRVAGILGVGVAWLASQLGMAIYAALSTRSVLAGGQARTQRDGGGMRRGDWRFLLPVPHPELTAVFAEGPLAASAQLLGGRVVDGDDPEARECDLCVLDRPRLADLRRGLESLRDGGSCYAEWPRPHLRGPRAAGSLLRRAGFDEPVMYWPAPWLGKARLWVRVPTPVGRYRHTLSELLAHSTPGSLAGRTISAFVALALRLGLVPSLVAIARKPCVENEACRSDDFCAWLERKLGGVTSDRSSLMIMMRTGGTTDENKVNWLVYDDDGARLRWIAKAPRHPTSLPALEREHDVLERLAQRPRSSREVIETPTVVLRTTEPGFPLFVQTAIHGTPLLRFALAEGYQVAAQRLASALATLIDPEERRPSGEWWPHLVEPWLQRLDRQLEGIGDPEIVDRVRRALDGFGMLPTGLTHNDCTPWNTMATERGLGVFDWETADEHGLPAVDLVYCLATTAFSLDGTEGKPASIDSYRRLMDATDERGAAFASALEEYRQALGLSAEDLSRLRVMAWLPHATHDLHNLISAADQPTAALMGECVCLPVLSAELDRHLGLYSDSIAPPTEAIFVSPHLDDAVLSCGATIRRLVSEGTGVTIATVFTADRPEWQPLSALAQTCHEVWGSDMPFYPRRGEDLEASAILGASAVHLGFLDAIYRVDESHDPVYARSQRTSVRPADGKTCLEPLRARLRELLDAHPHATVFCPSGVGGHVDHVLVRQALEDVAPARLVYYDEYPYLAWSCGNGRDSSHGKRYVVVRPAPDELDASVMASACYVTQVPGLFPSHGERLLRVARERLPRACAWVPVHHGSTPHAMRRMEAKLRRDKERHGERYSWADAGWDGPFGNERA